MKTNRLFVRLNSAIAIFAAMFYLSVVAVADPLNDKRGVDKKPAREQDTFSDRGSDTFSEASTPTTQPESPRDDREGKEKKDKKGDGIIALDATEPDIVVVGVSVTPSGGSPGDSGVPGQTAQMSVIIINNGAPATNFRVDSWFNQPTMPNFGSIGNFSTIVSSLGTGQSLTIANTFSFSSFGASLAWCIVSGVVGETATLNNSDWVKYHVVTLGDVVPRHHQFSSGVADSVTITVLSNPHGNGVTWPPHCPTVQINPINAGTFDPIVTNNRGDASITFYSNPAFAGLVTITWICGPSSISATISIPRIDSIVGTLAATPCRRTPTFPRVNGTVESTTDSQDFLDANTFIMMRNAGNLALEARGVIPPGSNIGWIITRASDEANVPGLGDVPPVSRNSQQTHLATLTTNGTGSFHITAFSDPNKNGTRQVNEPGKTFNVVLVDLSVISTAIYSTGSSTFSAQVLPNGWLQVYSDNGFLHGGFGNVPPTGSNYSTATFVEYPIGMIATVKLIGGGSLSRRGLEDQGGLTSKITVGWLQNVTNESNIGTYSATRREVYKFVADPATPNPIVANTYPNPAPPPATLPVTILPCSVNLPILDAHPSMAPVNGGTAAFLVSSTDFTKRNLPTGGQERDVLVVDPPQIFYDIPHPLAGTLTLQGIQGSHVFRNHLVAYSENSRQNFMAYGYFVWSIGFGKFTAPSTWSPQHSGASGAFFPSAPKKAQDAAIEPCPPLGVEIMKRDAR